MESEFNDDQSKNLNDLKMDTPIHIDSYTLLNKKYQDNKKNTIKEKSNWMKKKKVKEKKSEKNGNQYGDKSGSQKKILV